MRTLILFILLCTLLQGCVGGVVLKSHTEVTKNPSISSYRDLDAVHKQKPSEATNATTFTSEWLRAHWGEPTSIGHGSGNALEVWTYKFGRIGEGVVPFVIIPIPLALPMGRKTVQFTLHDGQVVSASTTKPWVVGGVAGFLISPEGGGKFGAISLNEEGP